MNHSTKFCNPVIEGKTDGTESFQKEIFENVDCFP